MQCAVCLKDFKNRNSYRVHRWRFHNPNSKYGRHTEIGEEHPTAISSSSSLRLPVAAATVGIAAASRGSWKRALILILILLALGIILWYLVKKRAEEEGRVGN